MRTNKLISYALIAVGIVLVIVGIVQFVEFRDSLGGRAASLGNQISRAVGGSTSVAQGYVQPILLMVGGVVAGGAGFFLSKKR